MDPKLKTALAVVLGVVVGVTLLGGAFASHAVMRSVAFGGPATDQGYGMMGQRQGFDDRQGMMGRQGGGCPGDQGASGACSGGGCPDAGQGMMGGPRGGRQQGPQDGTGVCPNTETCPNVPTAPTTES